MTTTPSLSTSGSGLLGPVRFFPGITNRRITGATLERWRYGWAMEGGELVQVAQYAARDGSGIVAQKVRTKDKTFHWRGRPQAAESLYGRSLCRDGGERLVVTEGELDALSVWQAIGAKTSRYGAVVSLANGAGSAERAFRDNLEWLESFREVVLLLDQDDEGRRAAEAAAAVLSPGKAKIGALPLKDASDMLVAGRAPELVDAVWAARAWRPDGVLEGPALWDRITTEPARGAVAYPWTGLQARLLGLRQKEIVTICAGTGIGKSTLCRELGVHLVRAGHKVGWVALEESVQQTALSMLGIATGQFLRVQERPDWAALKPTWDQVFADRVAMLDHFGSLESKKLLARIRYLVKGLGCTWVGLDHVTIALSGLEGENERKDLDVLMTNLRTLVEETGCGLLLVSQLKRRGQGPQYEDGAMPRLSDMRGSALLEQTSDVVIGMGRKQSENEGMVHLEVLKNRPVSMTGPAGTLEWDQEQGRYREVTLFEGTDAD